MSETTHTTERKGDAPPGAAPASADGTGAPDTPQKKPAPAPSPPPPRGPRWRTIAVVVVASLIALWIGVTWGDNLRSGLSSLWARVGSAENEDASDGTNDSKGSSFYTCGMHPWVILPDEGICPICQMDLTPIDPNKFTGEITVDPVVTHSIGVRIEPVTTGPLVKTIRTVGTIDYDETKVRDVNIKVPGWIEALHVDYLGAEVAAGDPLFDFYSPELYAAQEEFLLAYRNKDRIGAEFVPEAAEGAQDMVASARTRLEYFDVTPRQIDELIKSGTPTKTMTMHSPHRGVVIAKHANEGMRVDQGMQVYRIADLSTVWVMVTLYEYQLPYVQGGQRATMTLPYIPGQTFEGEVIYIYPYLDKATRQINVRLEFDNPAGLLKPGMYANVALENTLAAERVLAPRSAIIDTGTRQVAFVSLGEGKFEPRNVRMGVETDNDLVEILDGLRPGEMVVTSGQFLLDSEAKIREGLAKMIRGDLASEQEAVVASAGASELATLPADVATALQTLLGAYFSIGDILASDSASAIEGHARSVAQAVDDLLDVELPEDPHFWHKHDEVATIRGKALELLESSDIEEARLVFADLSIALSKLTRATGIPPAYDAEVHELHCPMYREGQGGSVWLQPKGAVRNPFYGSVMLECFDERSVIPVTGAAADAVAPASAGASSTTDDVASPGPAVALDSGAQAALDRLLTSYFDVQDKLTKDDAESVPERLRAIGDAAAELQNNAEESVAALAERMRAAAEKAPTDLEGQRSVFLTISDALLELLPIAGASESVAPSIYEVYCPMEKKSWLQPFEQVANPYAPYMLRCGSVKRTFKSRDNGETNR